jgi:predicted nucleic acid-binding Zn ribbon protein
MPVYCFECPECGAKKEVVRSMRDSDAPEYCACEGNPVMVRDRQAELSNVNGTEKGDTFWSQSLAISPDQTVEHRRLFPNVRVRADGCLGFDSVAERARYCERCGFEKKSGKPRVGKQLTPAKRQAT